MIPQRVVALDMPDLKSSLAFLDGLRGESFICKVGATLFVREGPRAIRALREEGLRVFLDLKLHDIPRQVAGAVEAAAALGVEMLTLHGAGGEEMIRAARQVLSSPGNPLLLAVTRLTSLRADPGEVSGRARLAQEAGADGVVCAAGEVRAVKEICGDAFRVVVPGIRFAGSGPGDQQRVATPGEAARAGADYVVLGRILRSGERPREVYRRVLREMAEASSEGRR